MKKITKTVLIGIAVLQTSILFGQDVSTLISQNGGIIRDGLSVDSLGNIYSSNFANTVAKIKPDGSFTYISTTMGTSAGNITDSDGNLFVSNYNLGVISKILPDGTKSTFASGIPGPVGLTFDLTGDTLFVASYIGDSVYKVSPDGNVSIFVDGMGVNGPAGICSDSLGNLYVGNFDDGNIHKITPSGSISPFAIIPGPGTGQIGYVTYSKSQNKIYATARSANKIYEVDLNGNVTHFAGTGANNSVDGIGISASFALPNGITSSPNGDTLYVSEGPSGTLRRIVGEIATSISNQNQTPLNFTLEQNYPNPFNPSTSINYDLGNGNYELGKLSIYNILGETIKEFEIANSKGSVVWDGTNELERNVSSGIYFYELKVGNQSQRRKMLLMK